MERCVDAQHNNLRRGRQLTQGSGNRHTIQLWGPHIDQSHGWPQSNGEFSSRFRIWRHGDDFNIARRLEQAYQGATDLWIAIHNENTNGFMLSRFQLSCTIQSPR